MAKAKHHQHPHDACPMGSLLVTLTKPWTLHILWALSQSPEGVRFGALRRSIEGISARMLTERLRGLEQEGFVNRAVKPTNPPQVTYSITPRMHDIENVFKQLNQIVLKWQAEDATDDAAKPGQKAA